MNGFLAVWLGAAVVIAVTAYGLRSLRLRRWAQPRELYWRGIVVLALVGGLAAGYAWDLGSKRRVAVPEGVGEAPPLTDAQ